MIGEPVRGTLPEPGFYALSGMEQVHAILRELIPRLPMSHLVGCRLTQAGSGNATLSMPITPWLDAGLSMEFSVLAELALLAAVLTTAPPATEVVITALSVNRFRPATLESENLIARARTLSTGPRLTFADVLVEDALGRVVAHATAAAELRAIKPPPGAPPSLQQPVQEPSYPTPDPYLRPLPEGVAALSREALEHDGLPTVRMMITGEIPNIPILALLGARLLDVNRGAYVMAVPASDWLCDLYRQVSPGVLASLAFQALTAVVFIARDPGLRVGVVSQNADFLRPVVPDGRELLVEARITYRRGKRLLSRVEITDADGELVVAGHQDSLLLESTPRQPDKPQRLLLSVVFTDLVASTRKAAELGDERWQELLAEHHRAARRQLEIHKGREVKTTGDGLLATFDSPARAVRCARAIREAVRALGLEVRVGVHTGECEVAAGDLAGIAVHVASRITAAAAPGEILVSATVRDLTAGSGLSFIDRGPRPLKGIDGEWQLFAVEG